MKFLGAVGRASENSVFSPTSIFHTLLMARGAADDADPRRPDANDAWNVVDQQMSSWPTLSLAKRVWPDRMSASVPNRLAHLHTPRLESSRTRSRAVVPNRLTGPSETIRDGCLDLVVRDDSGRIREAIVRWRCRRLPDTSHRN